MTVTMSDRLQEPSGAEVSSNTDSRAAGRDYNTSTYNLNLHASHRFSPGRRQTDHCKLVDLKLAEFRSVRVTNLSSPLIYH